MTDDHGWPEIYPREHSNLISKEEQEKYPWIFKCGAKGCHWTTAHQTKEKAQATKEKHTCGQELRQMPRSNGEDLHTGYQGKSIVERIWEHLDEATKVVMESVADKKAGTPFDEDKEKAFNEARGNARGLAIAIFEYAHGTGFFDSSTDVATLAVARYKAKVKGEEPPQTPGLNGFNPHLDAERNRIRTREKAESAQRTSAPADTVSSTSGPEIKNKRGKALSETDIEAIKKGLGANLPHASLANVYKITEDQVKQIADLIASS